jgi:hypothetical protein
MDIRSPLIAHAQAAEVIEPGQRALNDPPMAAQAHAGVDALAGDAHLDVATAQGPTAARIVIALVGMELVRPLAPLTCRRLYGRDDIEEVLEQHRVMPLGTAQERGEREASAVSHTMALRAGHPLGLAPIRRIRADELPPLVAGILALSSAARLQSMRSASPSRSSSVWCSRSQTPAACQSRKRRQQVIPEPQPISGGNTSQGMPLLSTKMIPVKTARSGTRGRPPLGLGGSGGNSGATRAHTSSLMSGLAI